MTKVKSFPWLCHLLASLIPTNPTDLHYVLDDGGPPREVVRLFRAVAPTRLTGEQTGLKKVIRKERTKKAEL